MNHFQRTNGMASTLASMTVSMNRLCLRRLLMNDHGRDGRIRWMSYGLVSRDRPQFGRTKSQLMDLDDDDAVVTPVKSGKPPPAVVPPLVYLGCRDNAVYSAKQFSVFVSNLMFFLTPALWYKSGWDPAFFQVKKMRCGSAVRWLCKREIPCKKGG